MLSGKNSLFVLTVIITIVTSLAIAQEAKNVPVIEPAAAKQPRAITFPYVAQVTGENVYTRAGNGTLYYTCGKLNAGQAVTVVGAEYGWAKILPPKGSFSWISKDSVTLEPGNDKIGTVRVDTVRIWAGSKDIDPLRSDGYQTKLNKGDIIHRIGAETSGYYKITPPTGAYLWVSTQFIKYVGPVTKGKPQPNLEKIIEKTAAGSAAPSTANTQDPIPPIIQTSSEFKRLSQCREISKLVEAQRKNATEKQDYSKIKAALEEIAKDPEAGKAKLYAKYLSNLVGRFELAIIAKDALLKQDYELANATKKIKEKLAAELKNIPIDSQFIVTGIVKLSQIFTAESGIQKYLVVADTGKVICYAVPADTIAENNLKKSINKKVTLTGEVIQNPHSAITLIRFNKINDFPLPQNK
ncbi:MAG: hypothetical protein FVQ79_03610 [Planctomycetes bacterium]|nr:hypothetical protein [Planctomycetota bacterium]